MTKFADTPKKSRIIGMCEWNDEHGKPLTNAKIFRDEGVSKSTGWRILRNRDHPRAFPHGPGQEETRGRKKKLTKEDVDKMVNYLDDGGLEARMLNWKEIVEAVGLDTDVSETTVRRRLAERGFRRSPEVVGASSVGGGYLCPKHAHAHGRDERQMWRIQKKKKKAPYLCPKHRAQRMDK